VGKSIDTAVCGLYNLVDEADKIMAFWNGKSTGTKYVIDRAKKLGKPLEIILINEEEV
jgi:hypothetical protein